MNQGYFSSPTVHNNQIIFVSEDDLWTVSTSGGTARRLTSGLGEMSSPLFSPNGKWVAFSAEEEGHREVYVMPSQGGEIKRLTYFGGMTRVSCWDTEGSVIVASDSPSPQRCTEFYRVSTQAELPTPLNLGPGTHLDIHPKGWVVLERNSLRPDPAHWKRYRGGTAGKLWLANDLKDIFKPFLKSMDTNFSRPLWVDDRIFFISDHEGVGNIYSTTKSGRGVKRHTSLTQFYARNLATDGKSLVFHSGGEIYLYELKTEELKKVDIDYRSQRTQRQRKYVPSTSYFEDFNLHPRGHVLSLTTRGQVFTMGLWDGPVNRHGSEPAVRYRLSDWMYDDKRLVLISDGEGEESIEIHNLKSSTSKRLNDIDIGIVRQLKASPTEAKVALTNNRNELFVVDLNAKTKTLVAQNKILHMQDFNWSPDGHWIAYTNNVSFNSANIYLYDVKRKRVIKLQPPSSTIAPLVLMKVVSIYILLGKDI